MSIKRMERAAFGQTLEPTDRFVAGVIGAVGAVGHALLGAAVLVLLYTLLFVA